MVKGKFCILLLLVCGIYFFTACESPPQVEQDYLSDEELNVEVESTYDVELIYSDSAIVSVIVKSPKMLTNSARGDNKQVFPDGVDVDFFDPIGRIQSELTCKMATRYEKEKKIVMQDSVVWRSRAGETLESEELIWDEAAQKLRTQRFVKITTTEDVIYGLGFEADQGFTKWKIMRPQGEMSVKDLE